MSKITSKNLHYDNTLPPFLQRLQANHASRDDRHEYAVARPKKARNPDDEAEDEPVYFNEETGESLTKSQWEGKEIGDDGEEGESEQKPEGNEVNNEGKAKKSQEKTAVIGTSRKRKAGKIVGEEAVDGAPELKKAVEAKEKTVKPDEKKGKGSTAKKGKKIKLSFGDEE